MIHILLPYMILPIANALRQIDPSLARAALGLGATPFRVFREVILPLSMPGVAAGVLLVFVLSLGFYITPALVGGPRDMTVSMLIAQQVDQLNWPYAACLSAALLAVTLAIMAVFQLAVRGRQRVPGGRAMTARPAAACAVFVALILLVMIAPIVVVVLLSFSSASYLTFPPPALGVRWYREYLGSRDWLAATWLSVEVAVSVVVLSTVLGTAATLGLARLPAMARMLATGLILSPLIMPVIIVAIGRVLRVRPIRAGRHAGWAWCWRIPAWRCRSW